MAFLKPKFKFGGSGGSANTSLDEAEQKRNLELSRLYISTRAGKHFQKDVVKGLENFISVGHRQFEVSSKLAEDCNRYGSEGPSVKDKLSKATVKYSMAKHRMEKERDNLHRALSTLVAEPLKGMANGSPLKDARQLKQKYDRLRQDVDSQAGEVMKRKAKEGHPEQVVKVQAAEQKLEEVTSAMAAMGRNALAAMSLVESQQQQTSLQKILAMVEYERAYFQRVTGILDQLHLDIEAQINVPALPAPEPPQGASALPGKRSSAVQKVTQVAAIEDADEQSWQERNRVLQEKNFGFEERNRGLQSIEERNGSVQKKNFSSEEKNRSLMERSYSSEDRLQERNHALDDRNGGLQGKDFRFEERNGGLQERNYGYEEMKETAPVDDGESFYATATHDFEGEDVGELTIAIGDEVLVRQVTASGWSEGMCNEQSGWFPSTYVKKQPRRKGGRSSNR